MFDLVKEVISESGFSSILLVRWLHKYSSIRDGSDSLLKHFIWLILLKAKFIY